MSSYAHAPNLTVCQRAPGCKPAPWTFNTQARHEGRKAIHLATDNLHSQQAPVIESPVEVAATGPREVQHKIRARAGIELPRIYLTHALLKTGSIFKLGRGVGLQEPKLVHWTAVEPMHQIQGHCPFFVTFISPTHLHIYITAAHPHCHSFASTLSFSFPVYLFDSAGQSHVLLLGPMSWKRCGTWKVWARNGREASAQHTETNSCRGSSIETVRDETTTSSLKRRDPRLPQKGT